MSNEEKYKVLKSLIISNWFSFLKFAEEVSADELDYQVLLELKDSIDHNVRDGARLLLLMHFPNLLEFEVLTSFIGTGDSDARDMAMLLLFKRFPDCLNCQGLFITMGMASKAIISHTWSLLDKIPVDQLDHQVLSRFADSSDRNVRSAAQLLLNKISGNGELLSEHKKVLDLFK